MRVLLRTIIFITSISYLEEETAELQQLLNDAEKRGNSLSSELSDARKTIDELIMEKADLEQ